MPQVTFSNPRHEATFPDWPLGGSRRGPCTFKVEHKPGRGYRVGRTTTGATKYSTYSPRVAIVDGSNGRTYILSTSNYGGFINISASDFKDAPESEIGGSAAVWPSDPRHAAIVDVLFAEAE
jgi:hypothetical protein